MNRETKPKDHITTSLQRLYYLTVIDKELGLWSLFKELLSKLLSET
jgi:hypothetical protein